ncbi:MAG: phosphoheptose isomerase [Actinomycetota bacterium]
MQQHITDYSARLAGALTLPAIKQVPELAAAFKQAWDTKKTIYLCGNGGSAGNAIHLANDFIYGAGLTRGIGLRIESLAANSAVLQC